MSKSAPKAPDYTAAAEAQAQSSREVTEQQTWANRPDQITPWSNQTWSNTPTWDESTGQYINRWQQNTVLNPELQRALDAQMQLQANRSELGAGLMGRAQNEFGQAVDWGGFDPMGARVQANQLNTPSVQQSVQGEQFQRSIPGEQLQRGYDIRGPALNPAERYRQDAGDAIYNQWADRALPRQAEQTDALRTQLYNMGFQEGDEGYDRALRDLRQNQNDAMQQASYQATIGSGQEAQRMLGMDAATRAQLTGEQADLAGFGNQAALGQFGIGAQQGQFANQAAGQQFAQNMQQGQFANQAAGQQFGMEQAAGQQNFNQQMQSSQYDTQRRQQQIAELLQQRGWSLNEINALLSGQQVAMPQQPGFNTAAASQATQYSQAAGQQGQAALDAFNAEQAALSGMMSGLGGMAMMSDRRLKRNIEKIGELSGFNVYSFEYLWGEPAVGFMADEVPHAIAGHINGFAYIDLGRVL